MKRARRSYEPHVPTEPLRPYLRRLTTADLARYCRRFECSARTAERHLMAVLELERCSLFIADQWCALVDVPFRYVYAERAA